MQYILTEAEFNALKNSEAIAKRVNNNIETLIRNNPKCHRYPDGFVPATLDTPKTQPMRYCEMECPFAFTHSVTGGTDSRLCILNRPTGYGK
jgi:hypothetical protein